MEKTAKRKTADQVGRGWETGVCRPVALKGFGDRGNALVRAEPLSEAGG